jgi:hypothetical protein
VLDGRLTVDLGEPPERHELERGSVLVVQPGTIPAVERGDDELVLFIYGAPPEQGGAEFLLPCRGLHGCWRLDSARSKTSPVLHVDRTVSPSTNRRSRSSRASGFSSCRWITLERAGAVRWSQPSSASSSSPHPSARLIFRSANRSRSRASWSSTMSASCSRVSGSKVTTSSIRLRNLAGSGRGAHSTSGCSRS